MRIGLVPESLWERVLLRLGRVPAPLADTHLAFLQARAIMTASEVGLWDALDGGARQPGDVAKSCGIDPGAAHKLMHALAAAGYLARKGDEFALTRASRRWLAPSSRTSLAGKLAFQRDEWSMVQHLTTFVRDGTGVDLHDQLSPDAWRRYQAAMVDLAALWAPEVVTRFRMPRNASRVLDLGGGHGILALEFCARQRGLRAEVIDLPTAVSGAATRLDGRPGSRRVAFTEGDLRTVDLGENRFDVILLANVAHHLSAEQNADLAERASRALRPRGAFAVVEWMRPEAADTRHSRSFGALLDLYFALTSQSGTWSAGEVAEWQRAAGLRPARPIWLRSIPGTAVLRADK
jgi:ubiquinone/menaquinone biosynthesis C-methylase UbiE